MLNPSPLETLASYAIAFSAGAFSVLALKIYGEWIKRQALVSST